MSKHTPGPWRYDWNEDEGHRICTSDGRDRGGIAMLWRTHEADARLIAAAPDLLKLCRLMSGAIETLLPLMKLIDEASGTGYHRVFAQALETSRMVIEKAEAQEEKETEEVPF